MVGTLKLQRAEQNHYLIEWGLLRGHVQHLESFHLHTLMSQNRSF